MDSKRIIVVGASRGLGRGIAAAMAAAGARVLAIGRNEGALEELRRQTEGRVEFTAGDATNPSFVARVVSAEDPDAVFIVLGATPVMRPIHEYTWESFSDVWNTDVKATFHWLQSLVNKPMRAGGRIVVFSSGAALNGSPLSGGYAPAKQAQRYVCDYMRGELARMKRDIVIQCVMPQLNPNTDLGRVAVAAYAARFGEDAAEYVKKRFGDRPLSPEITGAEMVRLLEDDDLRVKQELMLAGAGLKSVEK
jgi:NAD(P)-dependent dehydrogenase (short-subunit alcohol dehydrogenase family)